MTAVATHRQLPDVEPGPCVGCDGPPTRTLGRYPYCQDCADEVLDDIRARALARTGVGIGVSTGRHRPEYGRRIFDLTCSACSATWSGEPSMPCPWCERALERQVADQRQMLLDPAWLHGDDGDPRYDGLSDVDKLVWDRTRNQVRGADSLTAWAERLARGVQCGLITETEARAAFDRAKGRRSA